MAATVYLKRITDWRSHNQVARQFAGMLAELPEIATLPENELIGIKLTFGEAGNTGYAPPPLIRELAKAIRRRKAEPFLTETNTLYRGRRMNSVTHLGLAYEHGFTPEAIGAPIILSDGVRGREGFDQKIDGKWAEVAHLAPAVRDMGYLISVAHMTGHMVTGFGGSLKNLGMGLATRAGKLAQHSNVSPSVKPAICTLCRRCMAHCPVDAISEREGKAHIDSEICIGCADCITVCPEGAIAIDWERESAHVQEIMVEYAAAVRTALSGRLFCFNTLNHITRHCDCIGQTKDLLVPDIGIVASRDPVALDQASWDLVRELGDGDAFRTAWPELNPEIQLHHGVEIGLGNREYTLQEL